jgi:dihydropteroate synthase
VTRPAVTQIGPRRFEWGARTYVMGIVNVTPDSFSGDGLLSGGGNALEAAIAQARHMVEEGADLIDVGGESTRPGHEEIDASTELERVVPVVAAIHAALPGVPVSVDTTKPDVAEAALGAGASLLNDVWGVREDNPLIELAAATGTPIVLMHNRAEARYADIVAEVVDELRAALARAARAGVPAEHQIVDPGFGFGKTPDHNLALLRHLHRLRSLDRPILLGTSRKSTLGLVLDLPTDQRLEATLATTALGIAGGADIVRVHDVRANVRAARMSDAIIRTEEGAG